jgi:hypothetical protein
MALDSDPLLRSFQPRHVKLRNRLTSDRTHGGDMAVNL